MQRLGFGITDTIRKERMKRLSDELKEQIGNCSNRENIICPICKYNSEINKNGSARIFEDADGSKSFKCFACGVWRRL